MIDPISMSETLQVLRKSLDSLAVRHDAIAANIANIDTPQYKRLEVNFQDKLRAAVDKSHDVSPLVRTHPKHFPIQAPADLMNFQPDVRVVNETTARNDGNNVDMDMEAAKLAENTALYNGVADVTSRYLAGLRHVITGGTQ